MIGEALRLVRVFHNMKQKDLAKTLDVSPSYLNEVESGKKQVTIDLLQRYSSFFDIPVSSLLYFAERKDKHNSRPTVNPIAKKALKMLDWLDTITRDTDDEHKVSA